MSEAARKSHKHWACVLLAFRAACVRSTRPSEPQCPRCKVGTANPSATQHIAGVRIKSHMARERFGIHRVLHTRKG